MFFLWERKSEISPLKSQAYMLQTQSKKF